MSSHHDHDDAWDALCTHSHEKEMNEGRQQGTIAGRRDGLKEGFHIGYTTALEYGMEIGFIQGIATTVASCNNNNTSSSTIAKSLANLQVALDGFPTPEEVLHSEEEPRELFRNTTNDNDTEEVTTNGASSLDVVGKMQRIRTRFKLLMVQLGLPNLTLKSIMDEATDETKRHTSEW